MHGFRQEPAEGNGFDVTPAFARSLVKALVAGDVLNALGYRIRPYELRPGQTDHALGESRKIVYEAFRTRRSILRALLRCRPLFRAVEVDRFRVKPKVMVIGEFWAMTTEGDGNHQLQRFLEAEGAEIQVQSLTTWMLYMLWQVRYDTRRRLFLPGADLQGCGLANKNGRAILRRTWLADKALRLIFYAFAGAVGLARFRLTDMEELASLSRDFYHPELRGGEGHMEVGKLIHVVTRNAAHMVVSVKPFGCLPSSGVSDGVQPAVLSVYPEAVFCPVETTGDNAVSFQSRILMSLFKAHRKAREEFEIILNGKGFSLEEAQARLTSRHRVSTFCPQRLVAGTAANMLLEL